MRHIYYALLREPRYKRTNRALLVRAVINRSAAKVLLQQDHPLLRQLFKCIPAVDYQIDAAFFNMAARTDRALLCAIGAAPLKPFPPNLLCQLVYLYLTRRPVMGFRIVASATICGIPDRHRPQPGPSTTLFLCKPAIFNASGHLRLFQSSSEASCPQFGQLCAVKTVFVDR